MPSFDIAIVGYGPVGQALAILLGQKGWRVAVFEKQPLPYPLPRAVHFDHEVARILQAAGVSDDLMPSTEPADVYEWRNAAGEILLRFGSHAAGVSGWPDANMFSQPDLECLLDTRARALPSVEVERGVEVVGVRERAEGVTLDVVGQNDEVSQVEAHFAVGCDGANSFLRPYLEANVTDLGFFFDWLIVDILPHAPTRWQPLNIQICDPVRPTTLVSGGRGRRRWEFMRLPGEDIDTLNSEATAWRLLEPWGVTSENARLERHAVYRFQARWVDTWRRGRLLLAGDAAHQMPPFAGQGMCSGVRDAANLAWKLDLILAGKAPMALLDTYATERVPHVRAVINFSMELGKVICTADANEAAARDAMMVAAAKEREAMVPPPPLAIGPGVGVPSDPHAGQLFVQGRVEHDGTVGLFDDVVGRGWLLVSNVADPLAHLDTASRAYFAALGGRTAYVAADGPIRDLDGRYAAWFADAGVQVVLQRPDFYIFGTAATVQGCSKLVTQLRDALECAAVAAL